MNKKYPYQLYASVLLRDGMIENWSVRDTPKESPFQWTIKIPVVNREEYLNSLTGESTPFTINSEQEHAQVFNKLSKEWFKQWEHHPEFKGNLAYEDETEDNMNRLKLLAPKEREVFIVTIVADSNDADYITNIQTYPREGFLKETLDQIINLKTNYSGHYQLREYPYYDDDFDYPLDIPSDPYNDKYYYCHSLESVDVKYVDETGYTWDVEI